MKGSSLWANVFLCLGLISQQTMSFVPSFLMKRAAGRAIGAASAAASLNPATTPRSASAATCDAPTITNNPLLQNWSAEPFHLPPFSKIEPQHFKPALEQSMKEHMDDLRAIVNDSERNDFESVIAAYDRAGGLMERVGSVFGNMCSSKNTPDLQEIQLEMSPILSRHSSASYTLPGLFDKIDKVYQERNNLDLTDEQVRLVERIRMDFVRAGANFSEEAKKEYTEIKAKLASLCTEFQQNVMKDEEEYEMILSLDDLQGCPQSLVEAARQAAEERNKGDDEYVITLSRSLVEPFLTFADRRDLRQQAFEAWMKRGEMHPDRDNIKIAQEILKLRQEQAKLHGYKTFADYQCDDMMAKTPANVMELLENVWDRAKKAADREREALEEYCRESGTELTDGIQPWDWRYYAEKVRKAKYDFDESLLKPYLSLEKVTEAVMAVSGNLFGLKYVRRPDIEAYHPDVDVYEVRETLADGTDKLVSIFIHDNYARPYKSSGAWMSEYRTQTKNLGADLDEIDGVPIVSNNNNFAKGKATLLSFDDALTLFHEMGHGHHGMLSNASYSRLASTNVLTDFVELPSQLLENWLEQPEVLKKYARHYETDEPVPDELLEKLKAASRFNEGFATIEYTSCALLDMKMHQIEDYSDFDLVEFERKELERLGMPQGIVMRHRPAHFQHLFSGSHYAAGYYVYLWADVLAADAFAAFTETGDVFSKETAKKVRLHIYSSGNTVAPDELFRRFRGRDPEIQFVLEKKGLL